MASEQELRQKYRDVLAQLESQEAQSGQLESVLRLLIGRLCLAGRGRDARLDEELRKIGNLTRTRMEIAQINAALEPLTRAVAALDQISSDTANMLRSGRATMRRRRRNPGPRRHRRAKGAPPLSTTQTQRALHATTQTHKALPASAATAAPAEPGGRRVRAARRAPGCGAGADARPAVGTAGTAAGDRSTA